MKRIAAWFTSLRSRRSATRAEPDLGDMGTTFGLDAAMPGLSEASRANLPLRRHDERQSPDNRPTRPARL